MSKGPASDPPHENETGDEGHRPFISSETVILEQGDELRGFVTGMHEITVRREGKDETGFYFEILEDERGLVRLSMSLGLMGLKALVGRPVHCIIRCTGTQKTPAGSMKLWQVMVKKAPLPELLTAGGDAPF